MIKLKSNKKRLREVEFCHFFILLQIICNVVYCNICTNAICNTLHIAWNKFNIFKFKRKEAGMCFRFSYVTNRLLNLTAVNKDKQIDI